MIWFIYLKDPFKDISVVPGEKTGLAQDVSSGGDF